MQWIFPRGYNAVAGIRFFMLNSFLCCSEYLDGKCKLIDFYKWIPVKDNYLVPVTQTFYRAIVYN